MLYNIKIFLVFENDFSDPLFKDDEIPAFIWDGFSLFLVLLVLLTEEIWTA